MKKAAVYIRVSTDTQIELSPDSQLKMIRNYANSNGYFIAEDHIYTDDGISGRTVEKRPSFIKMINAAKVCPRPFDVILVWKFSRFARNREDSIVYKSMLKKECGIDVLSISEPIGNDKTSILIEALLEAMDEYYSLNLAEEVRRGMTEKALRGGINGSAPYGYKVLDGKYIIDKDAAEIVKYIFRLFINGLSYSRIASELNRMKINNSRGNPFSDRNIEYILSNIVYTGKIRWNPYGHSSRANKYIYTDDTIVSEGIHPAIISTDLFEAAQKMISQKKFTKHNLSSANNYIFKGLVYCSSCGSQLIHINKGQYLQCCNYLKGKCRVSHCISLKKLKEAVFNDLYNYIEQYTKLIFKDNNISKDITRITAAQIKKNNQKLKRLKESYLCGIESLEDYRKEKQIIENELDTLKNKYNDLKKIPDEISVDLKKLLNNPELPLEISAEILESVINKIIFFRKENRIQIFYAG